MTKLAALLFVLILVALLSRLAELPAAFVLRTIAGCVLLPLGMLTVAMLTGRRLREMSEADHDR